MERAEYPARVAVNTATRGALPTFGWTTRYSELLWTLVRRELRARFRGSALGLSGPCSTRWR